MKKITPVLFLTLSFFLLASCSKKVIFEETTIFPDANWAFENKAVTFVAPLTGSDKPYAVILELELIGTPNVEMFYASFTLTSPGGGNTIKPLTFNLINPGEPYIIGTLDNEKIYRMIVYPKKYFSETGDYTFEVNQFSNKADNYGIKALRMRIEGVKE
jgi:hypothetical protein